MNWSKGVFETAVRTRAAASQNNLFATELHHLFNECLVPCHSEDSLNCTWAPGLLCNCRGSYLIQTETHTHSYLSSSTFSNIQSPERWLCS